MAQCGAGLQFHIHTAQVRWNSKALTTTNALIYTKRGGGLDSSQREENGRQKRILDGIQKGTPCIYYVIFVLGSKTGGALNLSFVVTHGGLVRLMNIASHLIFLIFKASDQLRLHFARIYGKGAESFVTRKVSFTLKPQVQRTGYSVALNFEIGFL